MKRIHVAILIAVLVAVIATVAIVNSGRSKGKNSVSETNISFAQKGNEEIKNEGSSKFLDGYRIIYDFNEIPEEFLNGYELGFGSYGMNNKQTFDNRYEKAIGKQFGFLTPLKVQYDVFGDFDNEMYVLTINKGEWLYSNGANIFDSDYDFTLYSLNNYLYLTPIEMSIGKISDMRKYGTSDEKLIQDGWTSFNSNGWTVYRSPSEQTNYACLFYFINEELVMETKLRKSDNEGNKYMTENDFKEYINKFTESVYFTKVNGVTDEKIVVNNINEEISLGEKFALTPLKETYITRWFTTETKDKNWNKIPTNVMILRKNDGMTQYSIYEYHEDMILENIKDDKNNVYTNYTTNSGLNVEIIYNNLRKRYNGFIIVIDGRYFEIYTDPVYGGTKGITSIDEMKTEVEYILTNIIKYKIN